MNTRFPLGALGVAAAAALFAAACGSPERTPPTPTGPVADVRLEASDGSTHTIADLARGGDVFLYGIKNGCPENAKAEDFYDELARAYQGRLVGLSNLDAETYPKWRDRFQPSYKVLFDPEKRLIGALGIERSPWLVQIGRDGQVVQSWRGYSAVDLENMSEAMARAAGVQPKDIDFSAAPERTRYG